MQEGIAANETHYSHADPQFLNAGGSYALATDFKLQATSPYAVRNSGANVGLTTDYGGFTVPSGGYPMGAWEFTESSGALFFGGNF
jgi:hypothetical protein